PVGKDDDGQCWPGFGPGVPHATDWRKAKQQGQTPSMDDVRAFWREHNFDLRVACVRREYDSEDDSETLQPAKTTRHEFRNRFGRQRNMFISPHNKRSRYDSPDRRSQSRERSRSRGYSRPRDYEGPREIRTDADRNHNGFETRNESRGRARGTFRGRGYSYQRRGQSYQDGDQSNQERYREAQKYNPYTKQAFNKTKNPINWNRTHQFEDKNREEGWDDNPNDDWTKRTQMQKDPPDNYSDRDSTWTEDDAHNTRVYQIQIQPKHQAPAQIPKQKERIGQPPNHDDIDEQETMQERLAKLQKENEELGTSDSDVERQQLIGAIDNNNNLTPRSAQKQLQEMIQQSVSNQTTKQQQQTIGSKILQRVISPAPRMINTGMNKDKPVIQSQLSGTPTQKSQHRSGIRQRLKKAEKELEELKAKQQLQQQENLDFNNTNVEIPNIQGTVGQPTGLQTSPIAEGPGLNAGLKPTEAGSISASNRERTESQINEGHDDNADDEKGEQTDEATLNQNKDYRVNINSQPPSLRESGYTTIKQPRFECYELNGKR
ncbi:MAG: hypothetical protein EZS28_038789, partial [Streblomastix strix]